MGDLLLSINGERIVERDASPTTTLLDYLRGPLGATGTKEGCAEGDCGACTVAIVDPDAPEGPTFRAVNSCLVLLPMVHGKDVYTVEALADEEGPHAVQTSLVDELGSQCGYCTPGVVMSMFEACYRSDLDEAWKIDDQLCGNLCRCTGYRPIRDATNKIAALRPKDRFSRALETAEARPTCEAYQTETQKFFAPSSFETLWPVLEAEPDARLIVGGTDLSLLVTKQYEKLPVVVSLEGIPSLRGIREEEGAWHIGASTLLADLETVAKNGLEPIERILRFFGSRQIKNRATVGGNLCNASPIGDLAPVLLSLDASVEVTSSKGTRTLPIADFFLDYRKTALAPGEILSAVRVPKIAAGPNVRVGAYKVSKRQELDISAVAAGMYVRLDDTGTVVEARLGYGGMAAIPKRAARTEAALVGRPWIDSTVDEARRLLPEDFTPIDDHRGSAWYRAKLAQNLLLGFFYETQDGQRKRLPQRPMSTIVIAEGQR